MKECFKHTIRPPTSILQANLSSLNFTELQPLLNLKSKTKQQIGLDKQQVIHNQDKFQSIWQYRLGAQPCLAQSYTVSGT